MTKYTNYGYSERRLQPCYLVGTSLLFLLAPAIGWFWASLVVLLPAIVLAKYALNHYSKSWTETLTEIDIYTTNVNRLLQTPPHLPARHTTRRTKTPTLPTRHVPHSVKPSLA